MKGPAERAIDWFKIATHHDNKYIKRKKAFIAKYKKARNAASGSAVDANANVTQKNIATLQCELGKSDIISLRRAIMDDYLKKGFGARFARNYRKDLKNHVIYQNDETSLFPYCASISLYPFLLNGLRDLGGSSCAPKHANGFVGGLINLIYQVASQFAGAVAVPETLAYLDHFLRKDYGEDYVEHLDEPVEVVGDHRFTLRHKIEDWFQQLVYSINQPAGARNYQSPFTNIAYFDENYFGSIFKNFVFPDGDEPKWETTKELQKMFMKWFNKERLHEILTFPVETANLLVKDGQYADEETADFMAEMWSEGHSFFMYQSDSVDALASCCRLRNEVEENVFSYTLGAGGVETGSKCVITLNLNRLTQDWYRKAHRRLFRYKGTLADYIREQTDRVHKYLEAWNDKLWDDFNAGLLTVYSAGFIDLDKQFLTVGVNGFVEAAEFLASHPDKAGRYAGIKVDPNNQGYKNLAVDILGTIKDSNKKARTKHLRFNTEFIPAENAAAKLYNWDKRDGYVVPEGRNLYNSYFYVVEDPTVDPVRKFFYQGTGFATECDGGVALHNNLDEHLSKAQYRKMMDVAVQAGCNYFTYNVPNTVCRDCGHISKHHLDHCEECGSTNVTYATRVIGYLKLVDHFSAPRQEEAAKRFYGKLDGEEK